jgi:O-antigen/teichoic acid export membrane protein
VVISSISIINWRVANIIVSKYLDLKAVADYEITIKLLMVFTIIPIIVTSTIYPMLITAYKESIQKLKNLYHKTFKYLSLYGFFVFTFIWSFSDYFIPMLFGKNFAETSGYAKEMFLVILIFPTIFLQANVIVAIKLEKLDMICNIITLLLNVTLCVMGLYYWKSLTVVNYAVFISFLVFHIIQDVILIKRRITKIKDVFIFYTISIMAFVTYTKLSIIILHQYLFVIFWLLAAVVALGYYYWKKKSLQN